MQATRQIKEIIGENIATRRGALKLTRRALALKIDVEQGMIYKWEKGLHRPSDENLPALCRELGVEVGWLYTDHGLKAAA